MRHLSRSRQQTPLGPIRAGIEGSHQRSRLSVSPTTYVNRWDASDYSWCIDCATPLHHHGHSGPQNEHAHIDPNDQHYVFFTDAISNLFSLISSPATSVKQTSKQRNNNDLLEKHGTRNCIYKDLWFWLLLVSRSTTQKSSRTIPINDLKNSSVKRN